MFRTIHYILFVFNVRTKINFAIRTIPLYAVSTSDYKLARKVFNCYASN